MNCPTIRAEVPSPCPRLHGGKCDACKEDLIERAAIIQYGQGTGWHDEKDPHKEGVTCRTREEADALAVRMAVEKLPGQKNLI